MLTQPISCTTQTDNLDNNSLCFCKGGELICPPKVGHVTKRTCLHFLRWLRKEDKSLVFDSLNMQSISFFPKSWQGVEHLALVGPLIELARGCSESACKKIGGFYSIDTHMHVTDVGYHLFHWLAEISEHGEAERRSEGGVARDGVLITLRQPAETDL